MAAKTVVTISRQLGCGGSAVGRLAAERLGFHYADREVLHRAAEILGVSDEAISWCDERPSSIWDRIGGVFSMGSPDVAYVPPPIRPVRDEQLLALEAEIITELARHDDCVVVGRGGAPCLRDHPRATHVLLHAPVEFRARRVMDIYGAATYERAITMIRESDRARHALWKSFGHAEWLSAANFHLAVDTGAVSLDGAADLIAECVRLRGAGEPAG